MHCWMIDLIIKYVAGLRIENGRLIVDPFDFGLEHFLLDNVICQGHKLKIEWKKPTLSIWVDGKMKEKSRESGKIIICECSHSGDKVIPLKGKTNGLH